MFDFERTILRAIGKFLRSFTVQNKNSLRAITLDPTEFCPCHLSTDATYPPILNKNCLSCKMRYVGYLNKKETYELESMHGEKE